MTKTLIALLMILNSTVTYGQSFEGKLTYKVEYDIKAKKIGKFEMDKDKVIAKMKENGEYFDTLTIILKGGGYIKEQNTKSPNKIIYKPELNKIYSLQKDNEYIVITDASKFNALDLTSKGPKVIQVDTINLVNGHSCKLLKYSWGALGEELYFYNTNVAKVNPDLFKKHNYEYLNAILNTTKSYPLEIIKTVGSFVSVKMTLVGLSEEKIDDSLFQLPAMKKTDKEYSEMVLKMTGSEVMEIKK